MRHRIIGPLSYPKGVTLDPASVNTIASMPYTTANSTASGSGDIYVSADVSGTPTYFELEWYKNDSYQGYLIVWNGSSHDLGPATISLADGDTIKFRVGTSGFADWDIQQNDSSGDIIYTGYVESA